MEYLRVYCGTLSVSLQFMEGCLEYLRNHLGTFPERRSGLRIRFHGTLKRPFWNIFRLSLRLMRRVLWNGLEHMLVHFYSMG